MTRALVQPTYPGKTDGVAAISPNIGYRIVGTQTVTGISVSTWVNMTSILVLPGDWDIYGTVTVSPGSGVSLTDAFGAISLFSGATTTDHVEGHNEIGIPPPASNYRSSATIVGFSLTVSVATTVYIKAYVQGSSGTPNAAAKITARRVG